MGLCETLNFSIFTFTRSYSSCVYHMMKFKGSNGTICKMMTSHFRTLLPTNQWGWKTRSHGQNWRVALWTAIVVPRLNIYWSPFYSYNILVISAQSNICSEGFCTRSSYLFLNWETNSLHCCSSFQKQLLYMKNLMSPIIVKFDLLLAKVQSGVQIHMSAYIRNVEKHWRIRQAMW